MPLPEILGGIASLGMGLLGNQLNNKNQLEQQQKLIEQQTAAQKQLGLFNQGLAYDMWLKTNYTAQAEQMRKAGLNIGLMYKGAGEGGTTAGGQASNSVTGGQANPNGIGMGLQMALNTMMQKAQIKNIEADTQLKETEAGKKVGPETDAIRAGIDNMKQATSNAEIQNSILKYEAELKAIEANKANMTQEEYIKQAALATDKLRGEVKSAGAKGNVDEATQNNLIQLAQQVNNDMNVKIEAGKVGIEQTKATTAQTQQQTTNLEQDEIQKIIENGMRENGIQPHDNAIFRKTLEALNAMEVKPAEVGRKMKIIMLWMKGEAGEQTIEHLKKLLQ